jgi:hypothetical protein
MHHTCVTCVDHFDTDAATASTVPHPRPPPHPQRSPNRRNPPIVRRHAKLALWRHEELAPSVI